MSGFLLEAPGTQWLKAGSAEDSAQVGFRLWNGGREARKCSRLRMVRQSL